MEIYYRSALHEGAVSRNQMHNRQDDYVSFCYVVKVAYFDSNKYMEWLMVSFFTQKFL